MSSSNQPVVHFPNLTVGAHPAIGTLVVLSYHQNRLPPKYSHIFHNLPAGTEWMVADNLAETFRKLGAIKDSEYGEIAGVTMKYLVGDIATSLFNRAIRTCERIGKLAQSAASAKQVEGSQELQHFAKDLVTLKAILDSRKAFVPTRVLLDYLRLSESIVAYIRGNAEAEALHRKIRAITAPRPARQPAPSAPKAVEVTAPAAPQVVITPADLSEAAKHDQA